MSTRKATIPAYQPPTSEPMLQSYDDGTEMGIDEVEEVHPTLREQHVIAPEGSFTTEAAEVFDEIEQEEPVFEQEVPDQNIAVATTGQFMPAAPVAPVASIAPVGFTAPPGYVLVEEGMYALMKKALQDSLSGATAPRPAVQNDGKPAIRLQVVRGCHIGDINKAVQASNDPNHEIEWIPNLYIKIGGQKYEKMDSFLALFNKQNPYSQSFSEKAIHHFRVLNPEVLDFYFKKKTAGEVRAQVATPRAAAPAPAAPRPSVPAQPAPNAAVTRRSELPPVGSQERKEFFLNRSPHGSPVKPVIPGMPGNTPEEISSIPVNRGQNAGRQTVSTINDPKYRAEDTSNPMAAMMAKAMRENR